MPTLRVAFDQPPRVHSVSPSLNAYGLVPESNEPSAIEGSEHILGEHSHAPPIFWSSIIIHLRI
jgi:hypothetical protein